MDIKAVKLLEDEGCQEGSEIIKKFIDTKNLLPARINTLGKPFDNNFEHYERVHGFIKRSTLLEYFQLLLDLLNDKDRCSTYVGTLIGVRNRLVHGTVLTGIRAPQFDTSFAAGLNSRKTILHTLYGRCASPQHILAHRTAIYCMDFDQRGEYVITGSDDYTIKIWSLCTQNGEQQCNLRCTLRGHVAEIIEVAVSSDNHLLASVDSNSCLVVWCLRTGQPLVSVRGSRINRVLSGLFFVSRIRDKTYPSKCEDDSSSDVSGLIVISSYGGYLHIIPYQHNVHLIHGNTLNDWQCCVVHLLPTIRFTTAPEGTPCVYWPSIACLDVSPGGLLIAAGCSDQRIRLYNLANPLKPEAAGVLAAHEESVNSVAFSHSGLKLATGSSNGGSCWLWRFQAGQWRSMVLQFRKKLKCRPCHLIWSAQDRYLIASMKNGSVYVYFGESGQLATVIYGHEGAIHALSLSPFDEDILATAGVDGRFQLWNISYHRRYYQTETDRPSSALNTQSSKNPLILHYRFPPSEIDPVLGLVLHYFEPEEDQPIWNGWASRRPQNDGSNVSHPNEVNHRDSIPNSSTTRNPISTRPVLIRNTNSSRMQKITACKALPTSNGVGFVVVTKSGLLSVFRPTEPAQERDPTLIDIPEPSHTRVDEQFLHWELDTAQWKEVTIHDRNPVNRRVAEQVSLVLGSPPASQSAAALPGGRAEISHLNSRQDSAEQEVANSPNQRPSDQPDDSRSSYQPPASVLFEIIHVPSMVPFHRLPPGYLTNLRGIPYPPRRQTKVPGRENPISPHDLIPSITVDEETGEDIVVDDIQFCPDTPSGYCPNPIQTLVGRIPGKNYMWCSNWLNVHPALIEPLDLEEFGLKMEEKTRLFEEELRFYSAGGEPLVSFGDQFMAGKSTTPQTLVMQPDGNCFQTSMLSSNETPVKAPVMPVGIPSTSAQTKSDTDMIPDSLLEPESRGMSFLHSFLCKQRDMAASSKSTPDKSANLGAPGPSTGAEPLQNPLNVSTSDGATQNVEAAPPTTEDLEDADDPDDSSEESEWSETVDVEIGWWHRQRRRRNRRMPNANEVPAAAGGVSASMNPNRNPNPSEPIDDDDLENQISPNALGGTSAEIPDSNRSGQTTRRGSSQCRRSIRQQRRMIAKRRLLREMHIAEVRAAKMEVEKRQAAARRSERFRRRRTGNDVDRMDEDTTSRDTSVPDAGECAPSDVGAQEPADVVQIPDDVSSRRERLKRRLIRSVDYALRTHSRLPLSRGPADGYQGPDCEGQVYAINHSLRLNPDIAPWAGPHFDWLSTLDPIPSPYIPQVGDSVVYLVRGHRDYVAKAWESGELPAIELHSLTTGNESISSAEFQATNQMPWIVWPDIPHCVYCQVVNINYHIVRIADTNHDHPRRTNRSRTEYSRKRSTRRTTSRVRQCTRPIHSKGLRLLNLENRINTDSNSHSSDSARLGGDSFVRLVVLSLKIDDNQPYCKPECSSVPNSTRPTFINVTYHDVDGILEFVILRHVFDTALNRKWQPGDAFICPVGEVWWRGRVLQDFNHNPLYNSTSSSEPQPSTSAASINPLPCPESQTCDPWLAFLVRWLCESESATDELTEHDQETILCAMCSPGCLRRLPENVDRVSAWDMHPWSPEPSELGTGFHGGLRDGFIHISPEQLRAMYGTSTRWTSVSPSSSTDSNSQLKDLERVIRCVKQIADLPISEVFRNPVDLIAYPDYLFVNPYLVDLGFILNRLASGYYRQKAAVKADFQQLLDNTIRYNRPDSSIVQNAQMIYELSAMSLETEVECDSVLTRYEELVSANTPHKIKSEYGPASFVTSSMRPKIKMDSDTEHAESSHAEDTDADMNTASTRCRTPSSPIAKVPSNENEDANAGLPELQHACRQSVRSLNSSTTDYSMLNVLPKSTWIPASRSMLECLIANRCSYFFRQPIDLDEYPDYSEVIETPMDLQTILTRLDHSEKTRSVCRSTRRGSALLITTHYDTVTDLLNDLNLIVFNSKLYNTDPDTQVHSDTLWLEDWITNVFCTNLKLLLTKSETNEELMSPDNVAGQHSRYHHHQNRAQQSKSASLASRLSLKRSKLRAQSRVNKIIHRNGAVGPKYILSRLPTQSRSDSSSPNVSDKSPEVLRTSSGRIVKKRLQDIGSTMFFSDYNTPELKSDPEVVSPQSNSSHRGSRIKGRPTHSISALHSPSKLKKRRLNRSKSARSSQNTIRRSTRIRRSATNLNSYYLSSDLEEEEYDD